jgi:hypothetical protein
MTLSTHPKPDFVDHFPRLGRGHGRMKAPRHPKTPPCVEKGCRLAGSHTPGSASAAGEWMEEVQYSGPDPGVRREKARKLPSGEDQIRPDRNCHEKCRIRGRYLHSVCLPSEGQRASLMERMLVKVEALRETNQGARILGEYAGVEMAMSRKKRGRAA